MTVFQFLNNRQLGVRREGPRAPYSLNFENVLSRFVCRKEDIFTVQGEEGEVPPFACKFRKDSHCDILAVANEDGYITLYNTSENARNTFINSFTAHHNAIFDVCWVPDKYQIVSGSGDHNVALWDLTQYKLVSIFKKHTASIKAVDVCHEQSALFASGSRDGSINIWDSRNMSNCRHVNPVISISQAHCRKNVPSGKRTGQKDPISSVSSVVFQDSHNLASAGVADGVVKIWDLRKTYIPNSKYLPTPRYQLNYSVSKTNGHGCTSLVFDSTYKHLYGCSTSNKIFKFDCHSYSKEVVSWYEGFRCATYFVKLALSSDDQYLLCGSSDDKAYVWKVSKPGFPLLQLPAHSAEVTSVSWSSYDFTKLATCGDDNKVAIWRIANTEDASLDSDVHAVVEPYFDSSKNVNPLTPVTDQNLLTTSKTVNKSPVELPQTPSRPSPTVITNFFSPVTSVNQTPVRTVQSCITENGNDTLSPADKLSSNKSPPVPVPSQVLTPSNLVNKNNIMNQSPNDNLEIRSSPEDKDSSPENKISGTSALIPASSIQNKENSRIDLSSETKNAMKNCGQVKRKAATSHSTPTLKRKATDSSNKSKKSAKVAKKAVAVGKTIMNYFSVVLSPDN